MEWSLLISAGCLVMHYISNKFCKIILKGIKVTEPTRFHYWKLQRWIIPQKMKVEWRFLISASRQVMLNICAKFCEIISNGIKVIKGTQFLYWKITRGNNSTKNVGGATVVNLCTFSGHALYLYLVSWNYFERYQSYRADTLSILKIINGIIPQKM